MPDLTIIVVTYNNAEIVEPCLASIKAGAGGASHEIIVVDNASQDGTIERVRNFDATARVLELAENRGFAAANNVGIAAARGRYLVLVNSDAFPEPGAIERLLAAIESHDRTGIVGGQLRYPSGRLQPSAARFPSLLGNLWLAFFLHRLPGLSRLPVAVLSHRRFYSTLRRVDWVSAAFCLARPSVGPLPTTSFMYGEDMEWCHGAWANGLEVLLEPSAVAVHIGQASVRKTKSTGYQQVRRLEAQLRWFTDRKSVV